jgi:hypothetical protein
MGTPRSACECPGPGVPATWRPRPLVGAASPTRRRLAVAHRRAPTRALGNSDAERGRSLPDRREQRINTRSPCSAALRLRWQRCAARSARAAAVDRCRPRVGPVMMQNSGADGESEPHVEPWLQLCPAPRVHARPGASVRPRRSPRPRCRFARRLPHKPSASSLRRPKGLSKKAPPERDVSLHTG